MTMPDIPRAVCMTCLVPYKVERTGITVGARARIGPYYIVHADMWRCPSCGHLILRGFADHPIAEHYQSDFSQQWDTVDWVINLEP
jgi:hypothetical protein